MNHPARPRLHFVGIGGIGMSGIAEVFLNQGYEISGSDLSESDSTRRLARLGARLAIGHAAENLGSAQIVVISSAVRSSNPEVIEAKRLGIPVIPRAEMLAELMRGKTGIAVAGTHGKTSTTSMLATVLTSAGLDPTLVIGGKVDSLGGNAKLGKSRFVVAEADESDGSFLRLPAAYGIITNIDNDHLDHYGSLTAIEDAFVAFVGQLPFFGAAAVCAEDPGVQRVLSRLTRPVITYGLTPDSDLYAADFQTTGFMEQVFSVYGRASSQAAHRKMGVITLHVPGRHNILNALAAIAIGLQLDLPFEKLAQGLVEYRGVRRRFEVRYRNPSRNIFVIDDYGHHPTEIAATLAAARSCWNGRIVTVFQPHRYTRTLHCREGFLSAFEQSDVLHLLDIYAAGEDPIPGVDSESLAQAIRNNSRPSQEIAWTSLLEQAAKNVLRDLRDGDLILCMGAGSVTRLPQLLIDSLTGVS